MSFPRWMSSTGCLCVFGYAAIFTASLVSAQSVASTNQIDAPEAPSGESSSLQLAESALPGSSAALPSAPGNPGASPSSPAPGGQENNNTYSGWRGSNLTHRLTFELGGGFNGPIGNDTGDAGAGPGPVITFGGNFTLGAGVRFSNRISTLLEYQFIDDKLPAAFLSEFAADDVTAGNAHINSITGSPVVDLFPGKSNCIYLVGGYGWYHKSTNLQTPELAISYYGEYYENVTVASFTSSQWGANAGFGLYHRVGGMYGESNTQIFAEARYTFIHTPPITQTNGLGTTELIPVTIGVRF